MFAQHQGGGALRGRGGRSDLASAAWHPSPPLPDVGTREVALAPRMRPFGRSTGLGTKHRSAAVGAHIALKTHPHLSLFATIP